MWLLGLVCVIVNENFFIVCISLLIGVEVGVL